MLTVLHYMETVSMCVPWFNNTITFVCECVYCYRKFKFVELGAHDIVKGQSNYKIVFAISNVLLKVRYNLASGQTST